MRRIGAAVREFFWQGDALRSVGAGALWAGAPGWPEFVLGSSALRHADLVRRSGDQANPAVLLYAAAARLLFSALTAHEGSAENGRPASAALAELSPADRARVDPWLSVTGEHELARLPPHQRREAEALLRRVSLSSRDALLKRAKPAKRVVFRRSLRIGALALAVLACCVYVAWGERPNLARHARVSIPNPHPAFDSRLLVDGDPGNIGFHTATGPNQVTLDLGSTQRVSRVVVYNRMDCCQERAIPLSIEVEDKGKFRTVARRRLLFDVWRTEFPAVETRFVRLISTNQDAFHLAEVEVY